MWLIRSIVVIMIAVAGAAASLPFLIEPQNGGHIPEGHQSAAALTIFFALLGVGAAVLFMLSLNGFKTAFKKAYAYICTGLVLHGLSMLAFPILFLYTPLFWTDLPNLLGDAPYLVGTILVYIGLVHFAKLLSLKSWLHNLFTVTGIALAITLIGWSLPHAPYQFSELQFDLVKSVLWLECAFTVASLPILLQLKRNAGYMYARPLTWLIAAAYSNLAAGVIYAFSNYVQLPLDQSALLYDVVGLTYALTQLLFLIAGYSFNRITRVVVQPKAGATPIDVITYVAGLVSQPKDVELTLDRLRRVTANINQGDALDDQTLADLASIYNDLETYMITKESLRSFTQDELRRSIQNRFAPDIYARFFQAKVI